MFFTTTLLIKAKHVSHPVCLSKYFKTQHCNFLNSFFLHASFLGNRLLALQPLLGFCGNSCAGLHGVWSSSAQILLFQVVRHKQGGMEKMCSAVFWGPFGRVLPGVQLCWAMMSTVNPTGNNSVFKRIVSISFYICVLCHSMNYIHTTLSRSVVFLYVVESVMCLSLLLIYFSFFILFKVFILFLEFVWLDL